jgi:hypothetical protein
VALGFSGQALSCFEVSLDRNLSIARSGFRRDHCVIMMLFAVCNAHTTHRHLQKARFRARNLHLITCSIHLTNCAKQAHGLVLVFSADHAERMRLAERYLRSVEDEATQKTGKHKSAKQTLRCLAEMAGPMCWCSFSKHPSQSLSPHAGATQAQMALAEPQLPQESSHPTQKRRYESDREAKRTKKRERTRTNE